jgi:hypothetical protein
MAGVKKRKLNQILNLGKWGIAVFLSKFHCEMNFIEQYSKRVYRQYPPSSKEADLEKNVLAALESVPLVTMRRCETLLMMLLISYSFMTTVMLSALSGSLMLMPMG